MGKLDLKLQEDEGQCVLSYAEIPMADKPIVMARRLKIKPPCNVVRKPGQTTASLQYVYNKNEVERIVVMIVCGPVNPTLSDEFAPNGCGTQLQAVIVFDTEIEVSDIINTGSYGTVCPSQGLDENFFAAASSSDQ